MSNDSAMRQGCFRMIRVLAGTRNLYTTIKRVEHLAGEARVQGQIDRAKEFNDIALELRDGTLTLDDLK